MSGWVRCLFGFHDWDQYGECRRNWKHVQGKYDRSVWLTYGGPWSRVAYLRARDRERLGREFQRQMNALGQDVSFELSKHVAQEPELADAMLAVVRARPTERLGSRG